MYLLTNSLIILLVLFVPSFSYPSSYSLGWKLGRSESGMHRKSTMGASEYSHRPASTHRRHLMQGASCQSSLRSDAACEDYKYPDAAAESDVQDLCSQMPFMPGCSLWEACKDGKVTAESMCHTMAVLATLCEDMPTMSGCSTYNTMCDDSSVVKYCQEHPAVPKFPNTRKAEGGMDSICSSHSMDQCNDCKSDGACPDPLGSLSSACQEMPKMSQCTVIRDMCQANEGLLSHYCGSTDWSDGGSGGGTDGDSSSCQKSQRSNAACEDYKYPDDAAEADVQQLCTSMPFMSGCSLWEACKGDELQADSTCHIMTVLATLCEDMPGMNGCSTYNTMCDDSSVIKYCQDHPAVPNFPKTRPTQGGIDSVCSSQSMEQCERCKKSDGSIDCPDPLSSLSSACLQMPGMTECAVITSMCQASTDGSLAHYCKSDAGLSCQVNQRASPACEDYQYPDDAAGIDVQSLCTSMPFMSGCSLWEACKADSVTADSMCHIMTVLATLCEDMPGMSGCSTYNTMCDDSSTIKYCQDHPAVPEFPKTVKTQEEMDSICSSHTMEQCDDCNPDGDCPDPLKSLSSACLEMPNMRQCANINNMCQANPGLLSYYCESGGASSGGSSSCQGSQRSDASCEDYEYPEEATLRDIQDLCSQMPFMPGCSLWEACKAGDLTADSVCHNMTVLATLCMDMPGMRGCSTYNVMCDETSVIKYCNDHPAVPSFPKTTPTQNAMDSICTSHAMEQCDDCVPDGDCPDPLASLSGACLDMPDMNQCKIINTMCQANGDDLDFYCARGGGTSTGQPPMRMYFHIGVAETVLWKTWVPRTYGEYAATIVAIFMFGIISMALKTAVALLTLLWKYQAANRVSIYKVLPPPEPSAFWWLPQGHQWWQNSVKASIMAISILLDYFNMLIAMTFNVGLFVAVILGFAMGIAIFTHVPDNFAAYLFPPPQIAECDCLPTTSGKANGLNRHSFSDGSTDVPACCAAKGAASKLAIAQNNKESLANGNDANTVSLACCPDLV